MTLHQVDLNRLQIFKSIVQTGSISKAALLLRQQKSRISRQLTSLEKEIGTRLFYRTTRHLQLTSAGELLFKNILPNLSGIEGALEHIAEGTDEISGRIRMTVPENIGSQLMGNICYSFLLKYPKVNLEIHASNEQIDLVRESFDLAIRIARLKDSTLIQKEIALLKIGIYVSPTLGSKYGLINSPKKLHEIPYLAFSAIGESLRFYKARENQIIKLNPVFTSNNHLILRDLAIKGIGFTLLPKYLADEVVERGQLVSAIRGWSLESVPVQIVYPNQKKLPNRLRVFIDHLKEQFNSLVI